MDDVKVGESHVEIISTPIEMVEEILDFLDHKLQGSYIIYPSRVYLRGLKNINYCKPKTPIQLDIQFFHKSDATLFKLTFR